MADLLDEVLSDKNEERKVLYLKKALPVIGIITLLIIIYMTISNYRAAEALKYNIEVNKTLIEAVQTLNHNEQTGIGAIQYLQHNATNHVKDIAALILVNLNTSKERFEESFAQLNKIINDKNYLDFTREYAKYLWINLCMVNSNFLNDQENQKLLHKYFEEFENEEKAFYGSVSLLKALYYINHDPAKATKVINKLLSSKTVSPIIQEEARAIMQHIAINPVLSSETKQAK